jgi:hypothetical protein
VQLVAAWNQRTATSSASKDTSSATAATSYFTDSSYDDTDDFTVPTAWYKAVPRSGVWAFTLQYAGMNTVALEEPFEQTGFRLPLYRHWLQN